MKVRESGMPDEELWQSFFDVDAILSELGVNAQVDSLVEIGVGYGTFTLPAAGRINGILYGFDYENEMIEALQVKLQQEQIENVKLQQRDILQHGTGLRSEQVDYVMLFNILHHQQPKELLREAFRVLVSGGKLGIIHWRSDMVTPRGPAMNIRPKPEQVVEWAESVGFCVEKECVELQPFHFGCVVKK